jgi:hypothetical protein
MSALQEALEQIWDGQLGCYDPEVIEIDGVELACAGGEMAQGNTPAYGGIIDEPSVIVGIKRALLLEFLADSTLITADSDVHLADEAGLLLQIQVHYRGKDMKINRRRSTPDNTVIILELEPRK